jgi:broad specificity phosphatase PhoE
MPAQVSARADRLISRLLKLDGNIALFAHGQIGSVLAARWIKLAVAEAEHFMFGTASLSILARLSQLSLLKDDNPLNRFKATPLGLHYRRGVRSSTSALN